jgi:hypothetical protein
MKPEACMEKVEDLSARIEQLEDERQGLDLPALDKEMLTRPVDNFEEVMAEGTNPQKKDLLRQLVKKVLVHDKRTIEIWYALPNQASVRTQGNMAPRMCRSTNRRVNPKPQVWFRIIHVAADGHHRALGHAIREQTVEIALGPKGAFKNGNVDAVTRRVAADRIVSALPKPRGAPKPPTGPKTPSVVELLRKAIEWQQQLDTGEVNTRAEIARREGITRARVTQIMAMLLLAPEIQKEILAIPSGCQKTAVTERALRPIANLDPLEQQRAFQQLISIMT